MRGTVGVMTYICNSRNGSCIFVSASILLLFLRVNRRDARKSPVSFSAVGSRDLGRHHQSPSLTFGPFPWKSSKKDLQLQLHLGFNGKAGPSSRNLNQLKMSIASICSIALHCMRPISKEVDNLHNRITLGLEQTVLEMR